jgi:hypothetical protein
MEEQDSIGLFFKDIETSQIWVQLPKVVDIEGTTQVETYRLVVDRYTFSQDISGIINKLDENQELRTVLRTLYYSRMDQKGLLWNKPEEGESSGDFSKVPYSGKKPKMQELLIYLTQLGLLQMGKTLYANQPIGADMLNEVLNSIPIALAWVHAPKQRFIGMTHEYGVAALLGIVYVLNYVSYCLVLPLMSTIKIMQLGGQFDASGRYQYQFPDGSINTLGNDLLRTVMPNIETADVEKLFSSFPRITISQRILELAYWTIGPHELATNYNNNMILNRNHGVIMLDLFRE